MLAKVRTGGDQGVVNVVGTRRAMTGDAARCRSALEAGRILSTRPVRRHQDLCRSVRMVPSRDVERERAWRVSLRPAFAPRPGEDGADLRSSLKRGDDFRCSSSIGARPEMNGAFGDDDIG